MYFFSFLWHLSTQRGRKKLCVSQDSDQDIDFIIDDNVADHDLNASTLFNLSDIKYNENGTSISF